MVVGQRQLGDFLLGIFKQFSNVGKRGKLVLNNFIHTTGCDSHIFRLLPVLSEIATQVGLN